MAKLTYCLYNPALVSQMQTLASQCGMESAKDRMPLIAAHILEQSQAINKIRRIFGRPPEKLLLILPSLHDRQAAVTFVQKLYQELSQASICSLIGVHQTLVPDKLKAFKDADTGILVISTVTAMAPYFRPWPTDMAILWKSRHGLKEPIAGCAPGDVLKFLDILPESGADTATRQTVMTAGFSEPDIHDLHTTPHGYLMQAKAALSQSEPVWTKNENLALVNALHHLSQIETNKTAASIIRQAFLNGMEIPSALFSIPEAGTAWTPEEDDILRQFYPTEFDAVTARLPGRTAEACGVRARTLGITKSAARRQSTGKAWRDDENFIIRQFYPIEGPGCATRLPGRTQSAVRHQANKLGLFIREVKMPKNTRPDGWTQEQDDILSAFGPDEGVLVYQRIPGKSPGAIRSRASRIGVKLARKKNRKPQNDSNQQKE